MAHESFEDDATAAVMNELFVNIKVDREERPDIDHIYMSALACFWRTRRLASHHVLDADRRTVLGRHLFSEGIEQYGRPSFVSVLKTVAAGFSRRARADQGKHRNHRRALSQDRPRAAARPASASSK